MTIGKRITSGFIVCVLISGILGGYAYNLLSSISGKANVMDKNATPGILAMGKVDTSLRQGVVVLYRHVLSEQKADKDKYDKDIAGLDETAVKAIKDYEQAVLTKEDMTAAKELQDNLTAFLKIREKALAYSREGKAKEALDNHRR